MLSSLARCSLSFFSDSSSVRKPIPLAVCSFCAGRPPVLLPFFLFLVLLFTLLGCLSVMPVFVSSLVSPAVRYSRPP